MFYDKLSLREWLAEEEGFTIEGANSFLKDLVENNYHCGDCTEISEPCPLCRLEQILIEYKKYRFEGNTEFHK